MEIEIFGQIDLKPTTSKIIEFHWSKRNQHLQNTQVSLIQIYISSRMRTTLTAACSFVNT